MGAPWAGARVLALAWALFALAGCQHGPRPAVAAAPEATVAAFARALEQGEAERAYALMSREYRTRVPFQAFAQQLGEYPRESAELGASLDRARDAIPQEAVLSYGSGEQLRLRREGDAWLITSDVLAFYDQSTPRAALLAFVRAVRAKRYDVLLRLIPDAERDGVTPEQLAAAWSGQARTDLERLSASLQSQLEAPIEITGERASMAYAGGLRAQLVREGGSWKVEGLE